MNNRSSCKASKRKEFVQVLLVTFVLTLLITWGVVTGISTAFHLKFSDTFAISVGATMGNAIVFTIRNFRDIF